MHAVCVPPGSLAELLPQEGSLLMSRCLCSPRQSRRVAASRGKPTDATLCSLRQSGRAVAPRGTTTECTLSVFPQAVWQSCCTQRDNYSMHAVCVPPGSLEELLHPEGQLLNARCLCSLRQSGRAVAPRGTTTECTLSVFPQAVWKSCCTQRDNY